MSLPTVERQYGNMVDSLGATLDLSFVKIIKSLCLSFLPVNYRYNSIYFIGIFCVLNNLGKVFGTVSRAVVNTTSGASGPGTQTRRRGEVSRISVTVLEGWRSSFGMRDSLGIPDIILCRWVLIRHSAIEQIRRISSSLVCALAFWSLL